MTAGQEETKTHEIVIIRRRANSEDAPHHGGVWKIAYADFMTAMMAFFLVMWLINAADKKVVVQVANYFNPLRLTDKSPTQRGIHDLDSGEQGKQAPPGKPKEVDGAPKSDVQAAPGKPKYTEQALFSDPYGVLARLATEAQDDRPAAAAKGDSGAASGANTYRDPFDPGQRREASIRQPPPAKTEQRPQSTAPPAPADEPKTKPDATAVPEPGAAAERVAEEARAPDAVKATKQAAAPAAPAKAGAQQEAAKLEAEIKRTVASSLPGTLPNIDVTVTEDGVLITLTDAYDFGMFAIASAEPRPAMVVIMEKIAKILQAHPQRLVVRGHTDGRPYRSGTYDNWRLSTARAHMAYYMLVRGGIDEKRFERVEGYADRSLRIPSDPEAAQNRRIEILLRKAKL